MNTKQVETWLEPMTLPKPTFRCGAGRHTVVASSGSDVRTATNVKTDDTVRQTEVCAR